MKGELRQFWVFGYGSLMWRPGFEHIEAVPALLHGFHRRLCIYSHIYRGRPGAPGLVLGLDRGGSCHGVAFRVAPEAWEATLAYLRAREQITLVYRETFVRVRLLGAELRKVAAVCYVVDRSHPQYAGELSLEEQEKYVLQGCGESGPCREYVLNTLAHLSEMGIRDRLLEALGQRLMPADAASLTG